MISTVVEDGINDTFVVLCKDSLGWDKTIRRGGEEMLDSPGPVVVEIFDPRNRILNIPGRNNSLVAAAAETLWVLAGRNDVGWLKHYLPRAPDFADDPEKRYWRAGYGPRMRRWAYMLDDGAYKRDQLAFVVWELSRNPASRRAIINLYDPSSDPEAIAENKIDIPCTQNLSFMVRNGKLDLTVFIRSNDLVWGFSGVNVFEFTVLQQLVSEMTKIPLGNYYHVSNNLHVYPRHREMVQNIARLGVPLFSDWRPHEYAGFIMTIDDMDSVLNRFFVAEEIARTLTIDTRADFLDNLVRMVPWKNTLLHDLAMIVFADAVMRSGGYPASKLIEDIQCAQSRHIMEALWKKRYMKEGEK